MQGQEEVGIEEIIEKESIENNIEEEKLIGIFKNFLANGYNAKETIENVSRIFRIDKREMLEIMKSYLIKNGKVKIDQLGNVSRVEEI